MPQQTILRADWVVPVRPAGQVIRDGVVVLEGERIAAVGPASSVDPTRVDEHLRGHVLLPGLVNAHTHLAMTLMRGVADDLPLMTWLQEHIWPLEGQLVNAEFCHDGARLGLAESLRGGVTCVNDMYFHPQATVAALDELGLRGMVGLILLDFPTPYADGPAAYFERGLELHDSLRGHARIGCMFAPHAPYTVGDDSLRRLRSLSDELNLRVHMHVHETAQEVADAESQQGRRPLSRLQDLGLLNEALTAVHMTQLQPAEIEAVAAAGASVVHCPESNLKLASGFCPVDALLRAGVPLGLGTDGAASNNDLDLLGEARTAALLAKGVAGRADALPAAQALEMATLGGAQALGLADEIGSLEPGKAADFIAIDMDQIDSVPMYDLISQIVYATGRDRVTHSYVAGRALMRGRELQTLDESAIKAEARQWQQRIIEGLQA